MKRAFRTIQFISNFAIILIALLLGFVVVAEYLLPASQPPVPDNASKTSRPSTSRPPQEPLKGKTVTLENINWNENRKTLVLYLSTTCRYCKESVPFYRQIVKEHSARGVKLVAVFPQPIEEAKEFLKLNDLENMEIYSASLLPVGVRGTPTLLLVNNNGVISDFWRGKLTDAREAEVLSKLSS